MSGRRVPKLFLCLAMALAPLMSACGGGTPSGSIDAGGGRRDAGSLDAGPPPAAVCGNGIPEDGEECDDGNDDRYDGCLADCTEWIIPPGPPIVPEEPLTWEYVPIEGAVCRDGRPAGFGISLNPDSDRLLIYLEGGGACFNEGCETLAIDIPFIPPPDGIFNRDNVRNPVRDWSMVYVPYCTGDVHAGDRPDATLPGVDGVHQFVGYRNIGLYLERLVPTFRENEMVMLTGISAGGFGAAANFQRVQEAFGPIEVVLVDDSGPPMDSEVVRPCLQQQWREAWNLDATVLADCGADCSDPNDWVDDMAIHIMRRYPERRGGLFSNTRDAVIRTFFGFGEDDCMPGLIPETSGDAYQAGLERFRAVAQSEAAAEGEGFGTYYTHGIGHTCLRGPCFYTTEVRGVRLTEWVDDLIDGVVDHVGPEW